MDGWIGNSLLKMKYDYEIVCVHTGMQELGERAMNEAREPVEKTVLESSSTLIFTGTGIHYLDSKFRYFMLMN